jgi:hypothetical protein
VDSLFFFCLILPCSAFRALYFLVLLFCYILLMQVSRCLEFVAEWEIHERKKRRSVRC